MLSTGSSTGTGGFSTTAPSSPSAANWVDYGQKGALDLFLTDHNEGSVWANCLFRNNGNPNAYSTCELVLLDVRTGLVPFTGVVSRGSESEPGDSR
jgi:hypothetical protein